MQMGIRTLEDHAVKLPHEGIKRMALTMASQLSTRGVLETGLAASGDPGGRIGGEAVGAGADRTDAVSELNTAQQYTPPTSS